MSHHTGYEPYIPHNPGDLISAEDWNEVQQFIKADLADNTAADVQRFEELNDKLEEVDAAKFGGQSPEEWTEELDQRYIKRTDPQAAGEYRRYFKQVDREFVNPDTGDRYFEPAVIEHGLCRYPIVEVYQLAQLFTVDPTSELGAGVAPVFDWQDVRFLLYYASRRDPVAELLRTESSDWFYWGDSFTFWLEQFGLTPAMSQSFDDLLNDFWGHMFDPGLEQDQFKRESYSHSNYIQEWIEDDKSVEDLVRGGQWDDLYVAVRPLLLSSGVVTSVSTTTAWWNNDANPVRVYHLSQNAVEIRVPEAMDLMVLLRT